MKRSLNQIDFYDYTNLEVISGECIHTFPLHVHETVCIGLITKGCAEFSDSTGTRLLRAGDSYVIPPYTPHALSSLASQKFSYRVVCLKQDQRQGDFNDVVQTAMRFIQQASKEFTLDTLSKEVHISKYHLDRIFKAQVGVTPYQYYLQTKIKKIRHGLHRNASTSDLAFDFGFSDQSHLCNTFKKHMGISPMQYAGSYHHDERMAGVNLTRMYRPAFPAVTL